MLACAGIMAYEWRSINDILGRTIVHVKLSLRESAFEIPGSRKLRRIQWDDASGNSSSSSSGSSGAGGDYGDNAAYAEELDNATQSARDVGAPLDTQQPESNATAAQQPARAHGPGRQRMLVAITSCNNVQLVDRMLASSPKLPWVDYVVVDDASTDNISAVVEKHGSTLLKMSRPRGLTALWNAAYVLFVRAGYESLVISNNDVVIPAGSLEAIRSAVRTYPQVDVFGPLCTTKGLGQRRVRQHGQFEHFCESRVRRRRGGAMIVHVAY